jgi:hypothetical protein
MGSEVLTAVIKNKASFCQAIWYNIPGSNNIHKLVPEHQKYFYLVNKCQV